MIILSPAGLQSLSEITRDIAQIFFASMFIEPLLFGSLNWLVISFGAVLALLGFSASFLLATKAESGIFEL